MIQDEQTKNQEFLNFNGNDLIIIDRIQSLPENDVYHSRHVIIIICTEGRMEMMYDGRKMALNKDELFLGMPGSVISDYMLSPNYDCKILAVKPLETTTPIEFQKQMIRSLIYIKEHPVVQLGEEELDTFFSYYHLLCHRIHKSLHRYYNGEIRTLLNAFLLFVFGTMDREMEDAEMESTIRGEYLVKLFIKMVNDDGGHHRLVDYYADRLHITSKYLSSLVRSTLDRTPSEIIREFTLKEIQRRLRYSRDSVKEISNVLEFPNTSFFGKYFKQYVGMTPNAYRKKYSQ